MSELTKHIYDTLVQRCDLAEARAEVATSGFNAMHVLLTKLKGGQLALSDVEFRSGDSRWIAIGATDKPAPCHGARELEAAIAKHMAEDDAHGTQA